MQASRKGSTDMTMPETIAFAVLLGITVGFLVWVGYLIRKK